MGRRKPPSLNTLCHSFIINILYVIVIGHLQLSDIFKTFSIKKQLTLKKIKRFKGLRIV